MPKRKKVPARRRPLPAPNVSRKPQPQRKPARAPARTNSTRRPRVAKGRRPQFHDALASDQLFAIVTSLTAELSVAFERIATLEYLLEMGGTLHRSAIEAHRPEGEEAAARLAAREALIERVFQVLEAYAGDPAAG